MQNPEIQASEQLLESAQNKPQELQRTPEQGPGLEGVQYWSKELVPIMAEAAKEARFVQESTPEGKRLPYWVTSVTRGFGKLKAEADSFSRRVEADSEAIDNGRLIEGEKTLTGSIERWYRSLGPTNESEDISYVLLGAVDTLESQPQSSRRDLLAGNLIQDAALRATTREDTAVLLQQASESYRNLASGDMADPNVRAALRHKIDCYHQLLRMRLEAGEIDDATFYKQFESLQTQSIGGLQTALSKEGIGLGDGELLEWASLIFLRHRYWSRETAEKFDVRAALLREDQAIYPWRVEGGQNPLWSYDTVVQSVDDPDDKTRVQLKAGHFLPGSERYRSYLPTVVRRVVSELDGARLRQLVQKGIGAVKDTYDQLHNPNMLTRAIDESALQTVDKIFERIA